ncbi:hypothetical protein GLOIN_2v1791351 [Rhizophagus irregularis DAOM 181602=DAOM 197198]|uniref:Uncharacterized protein n=1 Tax=Rhizophagus irregularis (strain DAOM 197198w) TaxID=1432141 RepID=A0A015LMN3_RHIIW|nr:hypothetical protein RirG_219730 [Rhizophagus irregularis DAOM 197198w]GET53234.1 hypothetical protein GLOIN_2v1791351 [Rhizophagus irregularis DAOM 181602=DAOM 197198]
MSMDKSRTNEEALDFISKFNEQYFHTVTYHLSSFVQDGFLKDLFEKNLSVSKDKVQILIERFGDSANPANFTSQAQATNIQPNTDDYLMDASPFLEQDVDDLIRQGFQRPPDLVPIKLPSMPDIVMPPVDQTAKPDVKTSAKNSHKGKKSSELEATQILTGYETVEKEQERI